MTRLSCALLAAAAAAGCAPASPPPSLALVTDKAALDADGVDSTAVIATLGGDVSGVVLAFSASGGALSSSAAIPDAGGVARVTLFADREQALLGRAEKPVTVRATVTRGVQDVLTATVDVVMRAPGAGAPALTLSADPPAALADGAAAVTITLSARRLAPGSAVALSTTAGALSSAELVLVDDGAGGARATATITAPASPADAIGTAPQPESRVTATLSLPFVADGEAQFDLTGTFAQLAPARIRMRAGTLEPNPQCVVAPAIVKVDVVQQGAAIEASYTTCFVTLAPVTSIVGEVENVAPPAFVGAIPVVRASFTLDDVALGAAFDPPASIVISGAELADPDGDALPTSDGDERVRDSDGDGAPGVTVINSLAGEQNITFRNRGDTAGRVLSSNRVLGDVEGDLVALPESSVLGVGNGFLPEFESLGSVFELVRVDGRNGAADVDSNGDGDVSCAEIVDAAAFVFSVAPPPTPLDCAGIP